MKVTSLEGYFVVAERKPNKSLCSIVEIASVMTGQPVFLAPNSAEQNAPHFWLFAFPSNPHIIN
jgi:hypothetical protein